MEVWPALPTLLSGRTGPLLTATLVSAFKPQQALFLEDTLQSDLAGDQGCGSPRKQLAHLLYRQANDFLLSLSFPWGEGRALEDESLELGSLVFYNLKLQEPYSGVPRHSLCETNKLS